MYGAQEHIIAWSIYMAVVIGLLGVFWHFTRAISWFYSKQCLRLGAATFLLMPTAASNTSVYWAPAWVVGFLELIFSGLDGFLPIGRLLLMGLLAALLVYLVLVLSICLWRRLV